MNQPVILPEQVTLRATEPKQPAILLRLAKVFKRSKQEPVERYPHTPEETALIANLSAMR